MMTLLVGTNRPGSNTRKVAAHIEKIYESLGIPLTIRKVAYEPVGSTYALRLGGRFKLPESLNNLDVDVPDLTITNQGLSGEIQMGSYLSNYVAGTKLVEKSFFQDTLKLSITGAHLKFGQNVAFDQRFANSGALSVTEVTAR